MVPEFDTLPDMVELMVEATKLNTPPLAILVCSAPRSPDRFNAPPAPTLIASQLMILVSPATPALLLEPVNAKFRFNVSIQPSAEETSSPPSNTVSLLISATLLKVAISEPSPI